LPGSRVVASPPLPAEGREVLAGVAEVVEGPPERGWLFSALRGARVLIAGFIRVDRGLLEASGGSLELVITRSSGVDHIDLGAAEELGVCVANQPEAIAFSVAEHALGAAIVQARRILEGHYLVVEGGWQGFPSHLKGFLLRGSTAGIVGLGRIGSLIALYLRHLGASRILYWSRRRKPELEATLLLEPASLERLFSESRIVFIALPRAPGTEGLIKLSHLRLLPEGAVLVNVGRGSVIEEGALEALLRERSDVRVALDVYREEPLPPDAPILEHAGRALLTPHFAGYSELSSRMTGVLAARQARFYLERGEVWNPVTRGTCREARDIPGLWDWLGGPPRDEGEGSG